MVKLSCRFCASGMLCPIHSVNTNFKINELKDLESFASASPPSVFIGSKLHYPEVNVGILSPPEETKDFWIYDAQNYWAKKNYPIQKIVQLRSSLVNSRFKTRVRNLNQRLIDLTQEVGMSISPVDVNIELKQKIRFNINFNKIALPMGPSGSLKKIELTSNPKVPVQIERVYSDTDLKAVEALKYLYTKNFNEKTLSQLLSLGILGLKHNRRLVPTRFSITAIDDTIGKFLIGEIKDHKLIDNYTLYFDGYLGNYYLVLLFPEVFNYELFETYTPSNTTVSDSEDYFGRKNYAEKTSGGYYAARIAVLEKLNQLKKQASALVLRFITAEYFMSLGVWVCRESSRKSLQSEPLVFDTKEQMLKKAEEIIKNKFNFDVNGILKQSKIIKNIRNQLKLNKFF